ncbi:hypothetical protein NIES4103_25810 [Nostoc sp. NIES-4103]|nr:hypothetical protein NIES4103_25810 [Nostoc sp. NIES-4103]
MTALNNAIEQNSLRQEHTNKVKTNFDVFDTNFELLNETEIEDLESLITAEFAQGLPNDVEVVGF